LRRSRSEGFSEPSWSGSPGSTVCFFSTSSRVLLEWLALFVDAVADDDHLRAALALLDVDDPCVLGELGDALRVARLEDLHHARETVRDVRDAGDAARVEGPHGQLGARLADRLCGDDPDRVADLAH